MRRAREANEELGRIAIVQQGTPEQGERLLAKLWPDVPAIADTDGALGSAFGLRNGDAGAFVGPRAVLAGLRAALKGHFIGLPSGNVWRMPGLFFVHEVRVLFSHAFRHVGDSPSTETILAASRRTSVAPARPS